MAVSIILFLIIFFVVVISHEFGHFIVAKKNGIRVVEFFIGMGPALFSFTKGGTKYSLKLLPIGGACRCEGEDASVGTVFNGSCRAFVQLYHRLCDGPCDCILLRCADPPCAEGL